MSALEQKHDVAAQETGSGQCCVTFALHDVSGAVEVGGGVSGAGHAVVLSKLPLVRARWTADAAMSAGVVVMSWGALDCRSHPQVSHVSGVMFTSHTSERRKRTFTEGMYYFSYLWFHTPGR